MIGDSNSSPCQTVEGRGHCLRKAREAAGLTLEDAATRLHMPVHVVRALEQEDWQRLGAPVFVRGQLRSYAKLLGLDLKSVPFPLQAEAAEPIKLVSHVRASRIRRFLDNTGRRAVYVVMTGLLVVPAWYATRAHLDSTGATTESLDVVPDLAGGNQVPAVAAKPTKPAQPTPYMASIAVVPRNEAKPDVVVPSGSGLSLNFTGESWIKVSAPDGSVIEKVLVKPGQSRQYAVGQVGNVVLGNATAVEVQQSGHIVDLKPFQRANVARFAVSSDGSVVPAYE